MRDTGEVHREHEQRTLGCDVTHHCSESRYKYHVRCSQFCLELLFNRLWALDLSPLYRGILSIASVDELRRISAIAQYWVGMKHCTVIAAHARTD